MAKVTRTNTNPPLSNRKEAQKKLKGVEKELAERIRKDVDRVVVNSDQNNEVSIKPITAKEKTQTVKKRLTEPELFSSIKLIDLNNRWPRTYAQHVQYLIDYSPGEPELLSLLPDDKPFGFVLKGWNRRLCYDLEKNEVEIVAIPDTVYNRDYISGVYKKVNDPGKSPVNFIRNVVLKEVDDKMLSSDSRKAVRDALPKLEKLLEKAGYTNTK